MIKYDAVYFMLYDAVYFMLYNAEYFMCFVLRGILWS